MFIKNVCPTRWSSRFSVCKSLKIGFKGVLNSLKSIALNLDQKAAIRHEAGSMYKKIDTHEFSFTSKNLQRKEIDNEIVRKKSKQLVAIHSENLEPDLENEIIQFKTIVKNFSAEEKSSMHSLLEALTTSKLNDSFPNVEIALKLFVSIPCSNGSGERSFSVLKRVKNYQRTSLSVEKMSSLALMNIENCVLQSTDWNDFVKEFAAQKARQKL
ncbi:uncharacterized protein LOC111039128 [Myzus persicae]|uniref:uncharacterized protein LOC111039128 n=1 Tax=Myzus persicae TaxID=13164 RepID=UPI000B93075E|nr:uncharacterized protein LOC111039128 [Myzus persicae]